MTQDELINHLALNASEDDINRFREWRNNPCGGCNKIAKNSIEKSRFLYAKAMIDAKNEVFQSSVNVSLLPPKDKYV